VCLRPHGGDPAFLREPRLERLEHLDAAVLGAMASEYVEEFELP